MVRTVRTRFRGKTPPAIEATVTRISKSEVRIETDAAVYIPMVHLVKDNSEDAYKLVQVYQIPEPATKPKTITKTLAMELLNKDVNALREMCYKIFDMNLPELVTMHLEGDVADLRNHSGESLNLGAQCATSLFESDGHTINLHNLSVCVGHIQRRVQQKLERKQ